MDIPKWIHELISGPGGLHDYEAHEWAEPRIDRDEAVAAYVIRCLGNPGCEGSAELLQAIADHRAKVEP